MTLATASSAVARRKAQANSEILQLLSTLELGKVDLFKGLTGSEINVIRATAVERKFPASGIIVSSKERAIRLFLISGGCVNYSSLTDEGQEILLGRLVPGDVFGIGTFLPEPAFYLGTAKAVRDSKVLVWDYRLIRHLASAYPRLAENALRIALNAIALQAERHVGLISRSARTRVALALNRLGMRAGRALPLGIELDINNEDLASLADVNVFTAIRSLKALERMGILKKSREKVLIQNPEKLLVA